MPHLMVIAAYDSQLKWGMGLAREFAAAGWSYSVAVPSDVRHALSPTQVEAAGIAELHYLPWRKLLAAARQADCVVLAVQGPLVEQFTDELQVLRLDQPSEREPVVVSGWVGIIIEKVIAGYLDRAASDVVAVNSADNLRDFTAVGQRLGLNPDNLFLSGLPLLPGRPAPLRDGRVRTVLFADQPTVPGLAWDRAYLYQRLADYARRHPDRRVLLKPRHRPGEDTFHVMRHHPETVMDQLPEPPPNFSITYLPITELLDEIDLMLTVSSTAALEAIGAGVRTAFVGDLGVHEKFGNHVLVDSGLITTFDELEADRVPSARQEWLSDLFVDTDDLTPAQRIVRRVEALRQVPPDQRPGATVARSSYLRGRVAIRRSRAQLPVAARVPRAAGRSLSAMRPLARRAELLARAVLPLSWHRAVMERLLRRRQARPARAIR